MPRIIPSLFRKRPEEDKSYWTFVDSELESQQVQDDKKKLSRVKKINDSHIKENNINLHMIRNIKIQEQIATKKDCPFKKHENKTIGKMPKIEGSTILSRHVNKRMIRNRQIQSAFQANIKLPVMLRRKGDMALLTIAAVGTTLMTVLSCFKLAEKRPD
ncbi:hypothetical protein SNEBB_010270 [Seison nebaliae]|nr:hypothetical protein SNEBB_010270 [Seison nebaliae]